MEYLWVVDGTQEDLITNAAVGQCADEIAAGAFNTDYANYANRKWLLGSGDAADTYDAMLRGCIFTSSFTNPY
jgi:hypothetical protein